MKLVFCLVCSILPSTAGADGADWEHESHQRLVGTNDALNCL